MWGSRDGRDPFLRIHKVTPVSRVVCEIPATSIGILRQSCKGAVGKRRTVPDGTLVPADRLCQQALSAAHRQTLMLGLGSVGCRGLDNVYSKKRGEVTMTCIPDLESDLTKRHMSLGEQALRLCHDDYL